MNDQISEYPRERALVARLVEQTEAGRLPWSEDANAHQRILVAEAGRSEFSLLSVDGDGHHPYVLTINRDGESVGEIRTVEVTHPREELSPHAKSLNALLYQLHKAADRSRMALDASVEDVFSDLDSLGASPDDVPF